MTLSKEAVLTLVRDKLLPAFETEQTRLERVDKWMRFDHERPHQPKHATKEYQELSLRAQAPWLALVVSGVAQNLYVDQYRRAKDDDNAAAWDHWQVNGLDARQVAIHRAALGYGHAYTSVVPGADDFGESIPLIRGHSPRRMMAFYAEPEYDEWPMFALRRDPYNVEGQTRYTYRLYDQTDVHYLQSGSTGSDIEWIENRSHGVGVCPVVRFANQLDLEGRTPGEVEPLIPLAGRIDQTVFDRLVVQRFASFVVRTVAGMSKPESDEETKATELILKLGHLLVAENPETKFGSLPATPLEGFISAVEADILHLAAVSQTPAHELIGTMANLSADAIAAARASASSKIEERKQVFGESWEQTLRLAAWVDGNGDGARDFSAQVYWRDTEIRSLAQAADALGKLATMLGVPVEILWERIPTFTQQDVERAKAKVAEGDSFSQLALLLDRQAKETPTGV